MINKIFNFQFSIFKSAKKAGFTVLESIVAIAILSLSVSGAFSAVQQSFSQAIIAKDEIKAFYLAQEAIEMIKNKIYSNQLTIMNTGAGSWLGDINNFCPFNGVCRVNTYSNSLSYCGSDWDSCPVLRQNSSTFLYGYNVNWPATNFTREVQIESFNANEISVTVRVKWNKGIINKEFKIKTHLFNLI